MHWRITVDHGQLAHLMAHCFLLSWPSQGLGTIVSFPEGHFVFDVSDVPSFDLPLLFPFSSPLRLPISLPLRLPLPFSLHTLLRASY